jgi:hypothetical protein
MKFIPAPSEFLKTVTPLKIYVPVEPCIESLRLELNQPIPTKTAANVAEHRTHISMYLEAK